MVMGDRTPGPTDYLFEWLTWLNGEEQAQFAAEFDQMRAQGSGENLTQVMIRWHNRAMQRLARRRRVEREEEGEIA